MSSSCWIPGSSWVPAAGTQLKPGSRWLPGGFLLLEPWFQLGSSSWNPPGTQLEPSWNPAGTHLEPSWNPPCLSYTPPLLYFYLLPIHLPVCLIHLTLSSYTPHTPLSYTPLLSNTSWSALYTPLVLRNTICLMHLSRHLQPSSTSYCAACPQLCLIHLPCCLRSLPSCVIDLHPLVLYTSPFVLYTSWVVLYTYPFVLDTPCCLMHLPPCLIQLPASLIHTMSRVLYTCLCPGCLSGFTRAFMHPLRMWNLVLAQGHDQLERLGVWVSLWAKPPVPAGVRRQGPWRTTSQICSARVLERSG